jgi:hypothetical protein
MPNAFLDETRTIRVDVLHPLCKQLRLTPTLYAVLDRAKPTHMSWPQFFAFAACHFAIAEPTIRGDLDTVYWRAGRLTGRIPDEGRGDGRGPCQSPCRERR